MNKSSNSYRPDIDGIRAVAVISVILFHAYPAILSGGFLGVDIFFVISGYLITRNILASLRSGEFSIVDFYARRIRRIFPSLLVVLLFCFFLGWSSLFSHEFQALGKHIAAGAAFVSNIALIKEVSYFDTASELKPLLHLWSLAVEEQFYILWPIIMCLAWRIRLLALMVVFTLLGSFIIYFVGVIDGHYYWKFLNSVGAIFYLPVMRFWELLLGAVIVCVPRIAMFDKKNQGSPFCNFLSVLGGMLIIGSLVLADKKTVFLWPLNLLPTLGTFCLILSGPGAWVNRFILVRSIMVWVGLISYPLYLWHWPLLSFAQILGDGEQSGIVKFVLLAISVCFAWLSYELVEKKLRFRPNKFLPIYLGVLLAIAGTAGFTVYALQLLPRANSQILKNVLAATEDWSFPGSMQEVVYMGELFSALSAKDSSSVLFIGDSHVMQYAPRIEHLAKSGANLKTVIFAASGRCLPIRQTHQIGRGHCSKFLAASLDYAKDPKIETVVIGAKWQWYATKNDFEFRDKQGLSTAVNSPEGLELSLGSLGEELKQLTSVGKRVYLVLGGPTGEELNPKKMVRHRWNKQGYFYQINKGVSPRELAHRNGNINEKLRRIADETRAIVIDPIKFLCSEELCPAVDENNMPIYKDESHLRASFVAKRVTYFDEIVMSIAENPS